MNWRLAAKVAGTKWMWSVTIEWGLADSKFRSVAQLVWERARSARTVGGLTRLASNWGILDPISRTAIVDAITKYEAGKSITDEEKQWLNAFAGEDYIIAVGRMRHVAHSFQIRSGHIGRGKFSNNSRS